MFGNSLLLRGKTVLVISRVISSLTIIITHVWGLVTPLMATHEPPSKELRNWREERSGRNGLPP